MLCAKHVTPVSIQSLQQPCNNREGKASIDLVPNMPRLFSLDDSLYIVLTTSQLAGEKLRHNEVKVLTLTLYK